MDPEANLKEQRELAEQLLGDGDEAENPEDINRTDALRLAELVLALDGWIRGGGFLPRSWQPLEPEGSAKTPGSPVYDALQWVAQEAFAHLAGGDCYRTHPLGKLRKALDQLALTARKTP